VTEADAGLGEALGDGREMRVLIGLVHGDHLLRLVGVQGLVILLIPAARLGLHAIPDRRRGGDGERLVDPILGPGAGPRGALGIRYARAELGGDVSDVSPELPLNDARIPDGMEVVSAWSLFNNGVASAVVCERHMERLVDIAHPMAEEFQRREPVHRRRAGLRQDRTIRLDRRDHASVIQRTRIVPDQRGCARQVDEMLAGALAVAIGPGAGLREQREVGIMLEELFHLGTRLGVELLECDLTNDLMPGVTPRIHVSGTEEPEEDDQAGCRHRPTDIIVSLLINRMNRDTRDHFARATGAPK
jgi:hypothetical protein